MLWLFLESNKIAHTQLWMGAAVSLNIALPQRLLVLNPATNSQAKDTAQLNFF